jgi:hypothetical protein
MCGWEVRERLDGGWTVGGVLNVKVYLYGHEDTVLDS